jgi:Kef-type K+ transport system membrane component KefB/mannitol/fructose-specific phosphotransferase system IIA component (Ntr-type)
MHHEVPVFLLSLAVLLGAARLLGALAQRLGLPAVVGEILAGLLAGKTVLGRVAPGAYAWLFPDGAPKTLLSGYTTVAVVLLLVVAGTEIDLTVVRRSGRVVGLTSVLGMVVPFALGLGTGLLLPDGDLADPSRRTLHAAFLGIALSISALPVIARTLLDLGLFKTDFGLIVIGSAVVNDLAGWLGFSVLAREFTTTEASSGGAFALSVGLTVAFVVGTLLVVRPLVDRALAWMEKGRSDHEAQSGDVLSLVMVLALVGATITQVLGMHAVFGGFVMGLAIGDSKRLREHTRGVLHEFVTHVFTPVFFATMALRIDFVSAFDARLIVIVLAIACVAKIVGCAVGARLGGVAWRESFAIGFGMNSRGAMEILLAVLAMEAGIINMRLFVALVVMAVGTSLLSGPAMSALLKGPPGPVAQLVERGAVLVDVDAATPADVIRALGEALAAKLGRAGDAPRFVEAALAREDLSTTGLGEGVAVPHAEIEDLAGPVLAFARTRAGVDFDTPDGAPVRLVFLLLIPRSQYTRELQVLAAIARLAIVPAVREGLLAAPDAAAVQALFDKVDRAPNRLGASSEAPAAA